MSNAEDNKKALPRTIGTGLKLSDNLTSQIFTLEVPR
jgi:hypothetical protein